MAAKRKSQSKSITVELSDKAVKKSVTRYNATSDDAAIQNVYVDKAALAELGDPDAITITITAA